MNERCFCVTMNQNVKGCLFAVLSAVIYGCMPLMAKYIYADGVNPLTLVFLRNLFSLVPLGLLALRERGTLKIETRLLPSVSMISLLGCCITPVLLFSSYRFIASGTATVFHFAYPAVVVLFEILFLRKKAQMKNIACVLLCVGGIALFYSPGSALNFEGSALSLLSALTFAAYVILLSHFDRSRLSGFAFSFYIALVSGVASFLLCLATGSLALPSTLLGWGLSVLFSLLVTTGAVVLFQQSTFLVGGEIASILSTLEPITSTVIGILVFHEPFGIRVVLGTALVVAASLLTAFFNLRKKA